MFQNVNESTIAKENKKTKGINNGLSLFSNVLSIKNIPMYILSLMVSMIEISNGLAPFGISLFAASLSNSIPTIGIFVAGLIGTAIKFKINGVFTYILTTLIMVVSLFIFRPKFSDDEENESIKIGKNVFISTIVTQLIKIAFMGFTIYDLLISIFFAIVTTVFYKIFVNSLTVIKDFGEHKAFSIEEVLGASLLLSIVVCSFENLNIYGFSIRNILSILIVLVLGWKQGILVGTTAGVTIGTTLGVITNSEPVMVASYAISGMIAGILNRFGKLGVIVGFCLGNIILAYIANGNTVELIHFREILIASIGLLLIPKKMNIDIEDFIGKSKFLPLNPNGFLTRSKETADKLNNVSETIKNMANTYKESQKENSKETFKSNEEIFISELLNNLDGYEENMLYDDISNENGNIIKEIFKTIVNKQEINRKDLLEIFARCNSFIVQPDDTKVSKRLEDDISQMVRIINMSYKISKSNFIWKKRMEENNKNIETQLNGVSKAISNMASNLENEIKEDKEFGTQKKEIIELLKQKNIKIQEISLKKEDRFLIEIYVENQTYDLKLIEKILSGILKEKIVFNEEASTNTRLNFLSDDVFSIALAVNGKTKDKESISGDNILKKRLRDGKYLIALSDGMGSGSNASNSSKKALKMLENLLESGFDKKTSIELINTTLMSKDQEIFATLDIAILDLYKGKIELIKSGACPTYIKSEKGVRIVKSNSLPAGIINNENTLQTFEKDVSSGNIIVMCSDRYFRF